MAASQLECLDGDVGLLGGFGGGGPGGPGALGGGSARRRGRSRLSEAQRLALEALLQGGERAYGELASKENLRAFLSDGEVRALLRTARHGDPGLRKRPAAAGAGGDAASDATVGVGASTGSLTYWPERSERDAPDLDLGWPGSSAYRGATRVTVSAHPGADDGAPSPKETVRELVQGAKQLVALAVDELTDADVLGDLLQAARRGVPVYLLLDAAGVGPLLDTSRNLGVDLSTQRKVRVRSLGGLEFCSRSGARLPGRMAHRVILVDGDKAATGTYSYTWSSSHLDRHLLTVLSGQAVEAFDTEFRTLYAQSRPVFGSDSRSTATAANNNDDKARPGPGTRPLYPITPKAINLPMRSAASPLYALVKAGAANREAAAAAAAAAATGAGTAALDAKDSPGKRLLEQKDARRDQHQQHHQQQHHHHQQKMMEMNGGGGRGQDVTDHLGIPDCVERHKVEACVSFEAEKASADAASLPRDAAALGRPPPRPAPPIVPRPAAQALSSAGEATRDPLAASAAGTRAAFAKSALDLRPVGKDDDDEDGETRSQVNGGRGGGGGGLMDRMRSFLKRSPQKSGAKKGSRGKAGVTA